MVRYQCFFNVGIDVPVCIKYVFRFTFWMRFARGRFCGMIRNGIHLTKEASHPQATVWPQALRRKNGLKALHRPALCDLHRQVPPPSTPLYNFFQDAISIRIHWDAFFHHRTELVRYILYVFVCFSFVAHYPPKHHSHGSIGRTQNAKCRGIPWPPPLGVGSDPPLPPTVLLPFLNRKRCRKGKNIIPKIRRFALWHYYDWYHLLPMISIMYKTVIFPKVAPKSVGEFY